MIAIVYGNRYLIVIITRRTDGLKCFLINITTVKNFLVLTLYIHDSFIFLNSNGTQAHRKNG